MDYCGEAGMIRQGVGPREACRLGWTLRVLKGGRCEVRGSRCEVRGEVLTRIKAGRLNPQRCGSAQRCREVSWGLGFNKACNQS